GLLRVGLAGGGTGGEAPLRVLEDGADEAAALRAGGAHHCDDWLLRCHLTFSLPTERRAHLVGGRRLPMGIYLDPQLIVRRPAKAVRSPAPSSGRCGAASRRRPEPEGEERRSGDQAGWRNRAMTRLSPTVRNRTVSFAFGPEPSQAITSPSPNCACRTRIPTTEPSSM